ncbi:MAG: antitoxin component YwqK of YwqJK toxin-antitoxin module [Clostridium sp.]|jgi:antitoxin component YwqK of YwqJK toxin-antitoxin module
MVKNVKIEWQVIYYPSGALKYEGFTKIDSKVNELIPCGQGIKYFEDGKKNMEGRFAGWFIETGTEYYKNGNIRFIGEYNKGPRNYYGPRYFVLGRLFNEEGALWYEGTFNVRHSLIGYPLFRKEESFKDGTEFNNDGTVKRNYINGTVK